MILMEKVRENHINYKSISAICIIYIEIIYVYEMWVILNLLATLIFYLWSLANFGCVLGVDVGLVVFNFGVLFGCHVIIKQIYIK